MALDQGRSQIFFLPFMAPGHMIPTMDMARLFSTRGLRTAIVTTPLNKPFFAETIEIHNQKLHGEKMDLLTVRFPCEEVGLPQGCESADSVPSLALIPNFFKATTFLQQPFEVLMEEFRPNCLIADSFFPWANSAARKFGIPCLSFHGCSYFSQCVFTNLIRYKPHQNISADDEEFTVPDLPHEIRLTRSTLTSFEKQECPNWLTELVNQMRQSLKACHGVIMNSFYQLEPDYADYYENTLKIKHWHIGPLSLYFREMKMEGCQKGMKSSIEVQECVRWLDEKEANSVLYICFGSMSAMSDRQLHELALALESSGRNFVLVVRKDTKDWMPCGFEARIEQNQLGLVILGWAPQGLILQHDSVGGFMTHCGWNSILEGVTEELPMVTWPRRAEQFYNDKLVTQILKIGVPVGVKKWVARLDDDSEAIVNQNDISKAIEAVMAEKEGQDMRQRAKSLKEMAKRAIDEGGSSYSSVDKLIEELDSWKMDITL